jgi:hypothetical protein
MNIGEPRKEHFIEPLELPEPLRVDPAPEEQPAEQPAEPVKEPAKEPVTDDVHATA